MENRELTCICCPLGCVLEVTLDVKEVKSVTGNSCNRGSEYGVKECTNPTRIVTSVIEVENGDIPMVPVKTEHDIPKDKIQECIRDIKGITVQAPVAIGDIIVRNVANTSINIIATRNVAKV
ncbi:DUF1667 domain-containing protein [Clostridium intestinale]|jgi:CxxC motif-containing protein|uniref:DUF1667 domain-containing protein n=1 Tax=Clostridium intestinale TaxID=36845 RepID=UPI002DD69852|nr:DUF1667 domain-containing protein [Clostridium intestinale]WRY51565.1 DUF1667 domain-containing protein [Clostridium intestinale]